MRPNGWNQVITLTTRSMSVMAILRQLRRFPDGIAAGINSGLTTNWELLRSSAQIRLATVNRGTIRPEPSARVIKAAAPVKS
jgi:hypothetical protein